VVTRQTAPQRRRGYDRRQIALLVTGAVVAAILGGGLGWLGNHLGRGINGRAIASIKASAPATPVSHAASSTTPVGATPAPAAPSVSAKTTAAPPARSSYPSWPAQAAATETMPASTVPVTTGTASGTDLPAASDPAATVTADASGLEAEDAARAKRAAARHARRLLAKSNPF
jgi:hypothetical protein